MGIFSKEYLMETVSKNKLKVSTDLTTSTILDCAKIAGKNEFKNILIFDELFLTIRSDSELKNSGYMNILLGQIVSNDSISAHTQTLNRYLNAVNSEIAKHKIDAKVRINESQSIAALMLDYYKN